jgi:hypothetical protein
MNICFFNTQHFGDVFSFQPFILQICKNNPEINFYYWFILGHILYENKVNNLFYIENNIIPTYNNKIINGYPPENVLTCDENIKKMFIGNASNTNFIFEYNNNKYIGINVWCHVLKCPDFCFRELQYGFNNIINIVNTEHKLNINISNENNNILPTIKNNVNINKFLEWEKINNDKTYIFFYNFKPRSLTALNYNSYIKNLAIIFHNIIFIVPVFDESLINLENIKYCDKDFDCEYDTRCTNLLMIEKIQQFCKLIFIIPSGSSWLFLNDDVEKYDNNVIYLVEHHYYKNKLNNWYNIYTNNKNELINNIDINNITSLIQSVL